MTAAGPEPNPARRLTRQGLTVMLNQYETERYGVPESGFTPPFPLCRWKGKAVDGSRQTAALLHRHLLSHGELLGK